MLWKDLGIWWKKRQDSEHLGKELEKTAEEKKGQINHKYKACAPPFTFIL